MYFCVSNCMFNMTMKFKIKNKVVFNKFVQIICQMGLQQSCLDRPTIKQFDQLQAIQVKTTANGLGFAKCQPYKLTLQADRTYKQFNMQFNSQYLDIRTQNDIFKDSKQFQDFYKLSIYDACYHGQWKSYKPHGKGVAIFPSGSILIGTFIQGYCQGQHNYYIYVDGSYYVGNIHSNHIQGKGKLVNQNVSYQGNWSQNVPQGDGVQLYSNGNKYIGHFQNGLKHGPNELFIWSNNQKLIQYKGQFKEGKINGQGTLVLKNKITVHGYFDQQTITNCTFTSNKYKYTGNYQNGKINGSGILEIFQPHQIFEGNFIDGKLNGQCKIKDYKGREIDAYFFENRHLKMMNGLSDKQIEKIIKVVENSYSSAQKHSDALIQICQQLDEDYQCKYIQPFENLFNNHNYVIFNLFEKVLLIKSKKGNH